MEYTKEQHEILYNLNHGKSIFVTGGAGVGKSFLIKAIKNKMDIDNRISFVTALTGCAACLIGGQTLHSWGGIGLGDKPVDELYKYICTRKKKAKMRWICTEVLIIDEISMMSCELFEKLNILAKLLRKNSLPFGGIQVIFVGDFCQLPPIIKDADADTKRFCFQSSSWDDVVYKTYYMKENVRQSEKLFQDCLNKIRMGICDKEVDKILTERYHLTIKEKSVGKGSKGAGGGDIISSEGIIATKLYPTRSSVDYINSAKLLSLGEKIVKYHMTFKYKNVMADEDFTSKDKKEIKTLIEKNSQVELEVSLCVGSQVMLLYNMDIDTKLVNGSRGVIESFDKSSGYPVVRFNSGKKYVIEPHEWSNKHPKGLYSYIQMPLKLAWSISQHKSQGITLDLVEVDIGSTIFEFGQTYTTLSRVKSLDGLYITDYDKRKIKCHRDVKKYYEELNSKKEKFDMENLESYIEVSYG